MSSVPPIPAIETRGEMPAWRWLAASLGLMVLLAGVSILLAWRLDIYGILRDPAGRQLITSEHERKAKYLLNQAYVPANYDALIIGASASVNWHGEYLTGYRFYNESVEGGDASEERKLVETVLADGNYDQVPFAKVLQILHRYNGIERAQQRAQAFTDKARAIIGGLLVSVVVTVFLVPCVYLLAHGAAPAAAAEERS